MKHNPNNKKINYTIYRCSETQKDYYLRNCKSCNLSIPTIQLTADKENVHCHKCLVRISNNVIINPKTGETRRDRAIKRYLEKRNLK